MDSRSLAFAEEIHAKTGGEGVHVVLNSLAGEFIPASVRTLARNGRFLELGKREVWSQAEMSRARPDVRYWVYDLGTDAEANRSLLRPMLTDIAAGLADGSLRPLPVKVFAFDQARDAMRYMAQARHIGKIVLRVADTSGDGLDLQPNATYLITGGLGALGLETARWLARRGARRLVLVGRRGPNAEAQLAVRELESRGVLVRTAALDISDAASVHALLQQIRSEGFPLRGVVHSAGALHDGILVRQQWLEARTVLRGKAHGAWVLHSLTREDSLDFFIVYSAAGALLGASGQGLYAAANLQIDMLAQARRRAGLPALSVAWGAWGGAGMAAQASARGQDMWGARGLAKLDATAAFGALERLLREGAERAAVLSIDWGRFLAQLPEGADRSFFSELSAATTRTTQPQRETSTRQAFIDRVRALPSGQRREALVKHLSQQIIQVLGLDGTTHIEPRSALKDIGLDSLMAVELRNTLNHSAPKPLPATLLFDYPTLDSLASYLMKVWGLEEQVASPVAPASKPAEENGVSKISDAEAEALLLAELDALEAERAS
jgi:NAD(P)-dependent dehydrogenase (short-subunit alcohol dehydrogenase family)/acyl carrier protein